MLKYILILSSILIAPICAETIRNIEYKLPEVAQSWERKGIDPEDTTVIYHPKGEQEGIEFMGINVNPLPINLEDIESVKKVLTLLFPEKEVDLQMVEKTDNSILQAFTIKEEGNEKAIGWMRGFSINDGTVVFMYVTDKMDQAASAKEIWYPVLRDARVLN